MEELHCKGTPAQVRNAISLSLGDAGILWSRIPTLPEDTINMAVGAGDIGCYIGIYSIPTGVVVRGRAYTEDESNLQRVWAIVTSALSDKRKGEITMDNNTFP